MTAPAQIHIADALVVHDHTGRTWTVYWDLPPLIGCAIDNDYYREKASLQGYGDDLDGCVFGHELCHHLVSLARGLPRSPTLYAAALRMRHPELPYYPLHAAEEGAAEALHDWIRRSGGDVLEIAREVVANAPLAQVE